jgi:hypothetical protein
LVESACPRSLDRKKRIMGMAIKITRLVPLGLLFVGGPSVKLGLIREDTQSGTSAACLTVASVATLDD